MQTLISLLLSTLAVMVTAYILPGIHVSSFLTALAVAIVFGIVNALIFPLLLVITLPINILTLGLFTLVIIGLLVMLVSAIVPGFHVDSFWWAIGFAVVLFIINSFIHAINPTQRALNIIVAQALACVLATSYIQDSPFLALRQVDGLEDVYKLLMAQTSGPFNQKDLIIAALQAATIKSFQLKGPTLDLTYTADGIKL